MELNSFAGSSCKLKNPWGDTAVTLYRNGTQSEQLQGGVLSFSTAKGERIVVVPRGKSLEQLKRTI